MPRTAYDEKDIEQATVPHALQLDKEHNDGLSSNALSAASSSSSSSLPSPAHAQTPRPAPPKPSITVIIPVWIVLSSAVIIYNNYIYNTLHFPYPVFLVTFHLIFAAIGTRILARTTHLLDGLKDVPMTKDLYMRSILPIGILFSASLILSNTAYLHLSVSFIQMLKAFNAVAVLLITWVVRIAEPNRKLALIVCMISFGVALTSTGELNFNMLGFIIQATAVAFEASRLVMIQILLQGIKMDPLVSLYYFAPVCAALNLLVLPFTEGMAPFRALLLPSASIASPDLTQTALAAVAGPSFLVLFSNGLVAFLLNIAAVFLVGVGGGLVLTLAGVFKDILLVTGSVVIFGSQITGIQIVGYSIALAGLVLFKTSGGK